MCCLPSDFFNNMVFCFILLVLNSKSNKNMFLFGLRIRYCYANHLKRWGDSGSAEFGHSECLEIWFAGEESESITKNTEKIKCSNAWENKTCLKVQKTLLLCTGWMKSWNTCLSPQDSHVLCIAGVRDEGRKDPKEDTSSRYWADPIYESEQGPLPWGCNLSMWQIIYTSVYHNNLNDCHHQLFQEQFSLDKWLLFCFLSKGSFI